MYSKLQVTNQRQKAAAGTGHKAVNLTGTWLAVTTKPSTHNAESSCLASIKILYHAVSYCTVCINKKIPGTGFFQS